MVSLHDLILPPHNYTGPIQIVKPKPNPWQGAHRLIDHDAFAASNARNTAICYAQDGYLAVVDDLSVLCEGWMAAVQRAMLENRVVGGAYRKVNKLIVNESGKVVSFENWQRGHDSRWKEGQNQLRECNGDEFFGCSFAAPVETLLSVNGFDECLDGLSFEDVAFGIRLQKAKVPLWYDQTMMTLESQEHHDTERPPRRNRPIKGFKDCIWEMLSWIKHNPPRSRGTQDLIEIRKRVLAGEPFPMHTGFFVWPDGKDIFGN